ncbi:poly-gamma-glutamate synthase PgsB [bacterium]|nr:poly-gamma-glutamate synthase PgsB [bacterium]
MELFLILLIIALIVWWVLEYRRHSMNVDRIKIRIHVNGTRGKSSVTRLIAGALREGGIHTVAKTTGTIPRLILPDGTEEPIVRLGSPNIHEQVAIVRRAVDLDAEALVIECMALLPEYQEISERKIIKSTIDVITNARPDHLDVMGPTGHDVIDALCGTISKGNICFTSEKEHFDHIEKNAIDNGATIVQAVPSTIEKTDMAGFSYIEHEENVALALKVAEHLGISRETAIRGMQKATPDIGALTVYKVEFFGKVAIFYNAFAANDPESTGALWVKLKLDTDPTFPTIVLANNRADRASRTSQLAEMLVDKVHANYYILTGTNTKLLVEKLDRHGMNMTAVYDMGGVEVEDIFELCMELTPTHSSIVGVGNIGGIGREILAYFEARALPRKTHHHDDSANGV